MTATEYPAPATRRLITASLIAGTFMIALDSTIANVALPHIQGNVSASQEEITWVLTSYIMAQAIFTPLTGWLAGRFGRKRLMLWSIVGFTVASGLCGLATNLEELVLFRLLQGISGAALVPMSQATLLDINPPEGFGPAMALFGLGVTFGPVIGPALGGWLTESFSWRWVFYINLPVGILAFIGLSASYHETKLPEARPLDIFGFVTLALAIGSLQLMLDRGQSQDWFSSLEVCVEAGAALFFAYLFIVHLLTARKPFIDTRLFADRNFLLGSIVGFTIFAALNATLALLPPMLETVMGYPVVLTGLVTAPRGLGMMLAMVVTGRLIGRVDERVLFAIGAACVIWSSHIMSGFSLDMNTTPTIVSGFLQGVGVGMIFVPLNTMTFATLGITRRNDGTAMYTLIRNMGSAIGISVLQALTIRNTAIVHSRLVEDIRPDNPLLSGAAALDFTQPGALARINAVITQQAAMVSYVDAFWALFVLSVVVAPLLLMMRARKAATVGTHAMSLE